MDPRRLLILAGMGLSLTGCAGWPVGALSEPVGSTVQDDATAPPAAAAPVPADGAGIAAILPDTAVPYETGVQATDRDAGATPDEDTVIGEMRIFAWEPGRVYAVRTAPLRVTTLTLAAGETLVSKAAGDTVRWQIGETTSGEGHSQRSHVLLKPLQRGLSTNLVLTTNRRVYLIDLTSGSVDQFNAAVAWDAGAAEQTGAVTAPATQPLPASDPVVEPLGTLDARYRIEPRGRRPRWSPTSVFNDGQRTFIAFDADLQIDEAPALFVIAADGETQMVNYRQAGGLFIVDRVFDHAELRLGDRRPQVVRLHRIASPAR